jgi:Zn finger protein HypA/HybF involved in hydrogenase expression
MGVKIEIDEVKNRLENLFGDKYEYDFSNFKNTHSRINVKCPTHGWSEQIVKNLFKGHGCRKCSYKVISDKQLSDFNDVLSKFKEKHGDKYDYSKFQYVKNRNNSIIVCPTHGEFYQSAWTHMKGSGCPKCSGNKRFSKDEFISASNLKHTKGYIYDFSDYKNMHKKVKIVCPTHGEFFQKPMAHVKGSGCPKCSQSKGEMMIEKFLLDNNIEYISQKKFDDLKHKSHLIFDFYLPKFNTCIEFNGIQHYQPIEIFGGQKSFEISQIRDDMKVKYCLKNDINLIIIKQDKKHIDMLDVDKQIQNIKLTLKKINNHL